MLFNVTFVGGIHGVGKSTLCKSICERSNLHYLSASDLIRWTEINTDSNNKKVVNIPDTQDRLIEGLRCSIQVGKTYLLDGHFCLLDTDSQIVPVHIETFKAIRPVSLHIILDDVSNIKRRLGARDAKEYDSDLLDRMQQHELSHAKHLSSLLGVTLSFGTPDNYSEILSSIQSTFHSS